ncbi:MAG TPA: indole-3-glycerol phosphate synthase TrpC [Alloiococcus sp.]|nr:indole-3-glycerol phosphate synthase TrpC [Alloiococcus sp.]
MTILDEIIEVKKQEVKALKSEIFQAYQGKTVISFKEHINNLPHMGIIAEIKRASPSKGMINEHVNPVKQAKIYEQNGVQAISVLTDNQFFKGSIDDLIAVRNAVNLPILCKDFIIDEVQIDQAYSAGANIILLIAAALDDQTLEKLNNHALALNLEVLFEVHNEEEMERVLKLNPQLVGINNRDLKTFKVDLDTTEKLKNMVQDKDVILISESGIETREDVEKIASSGAESILIGETLMKAANLDQTIKNLQVDLNEVK